MRLASRAAALALTLALAPAARGEERAEEPPWPFLAALRVELAPGATRDGPLRAIIALNPGAEAKLDSLREWFPRARAVDGRVAVVLEGRAPAARARPAEAHRRATFVVDFDEPAVAALREEVARRAAGEPALADLAAAVDAWITKKSLGALMDVASTVAARRTGDCSEHAVLLAAVARQHGRAARVVFGVALLPVGEELRAFGHAWTEIHDGAAWQAVDATPLPAGARYLPLAVLADEGPGFVATAFYRLSPLDVRAISLAPAR